MQQLVEAVKLALRALQSYRLRAFLTMLGISIGIFAITFVFTLVNSMQYSISKNLSELGNTVLFIHHWPWKDNSEDWFKYYNRPKVSYKDYQTLKRSLKQVSALAYWATKHGDKIKTVKKRTAENITIRGVTYDFLEINNMTFAEGRYFTSYEVESARNVCIIGYYIARSLMDEGPYVGNYIELNGKKLKVIGVLEKKGKNLFGDNQDEYFVIPYPLFQTIYNVDQRRIDKVIAAKANSYEKVEQVESDITSLIRIARGLKPGTEDNFSINKQESLMEQLNKLFEYLNLGGIIISLFSLLIGGFGIANIMFVSVKERTKEIGIQKALGANRGFILLQFLVEAIILCLIGGLIGLGLLFSVSGLAALLFSWAGIEISIVILPKDIILSLMLSAFIGLLSGITPSYAAARLNPVTAIQSK